MDLFFAGLYLDFKYTNIHEQTLFLKLGLNLFAGLYLDFKYLECQLKGYSYIEMRILYS